MPTLEEMRKWLQGERVEELPDREPPPSSEDETIHRQVMESTWSEDEVSKTLEEAERCIKPAPPETPPVESWYPDKTIGTLVGDWIERDKYDIKEDGTDARIKFGTWKNDLVSDMASSTEGMDYLKWMLKDGGFIRPADKDMMRVIKAYVHPLSPEAEEMEARKRVSLAFGPVPGVSKAMRKRSREEEPRIKERKERVRAKIKRKAVAKGWKEVEEEAKKVRDERPRSETREIKTLVKGDGTIVNIADVAEEVRKAHAEGLVHPSEVEGTGDCDFCDRPAKYALIGGHVVCDQPACRWRAESHGRHGI